jgi:exosortase
MKQFRLQAFALPVLAATIFSVLTFPIWQWLWREWMGNDYYGHGVLIPFVVLFLLIQRLRNDPTTSLIPSADNQGGLLMVGVSMALMLFFLNRRAYYLAALVMIVLFAALIWSFTSFALLRKLLFPIAYLALMVPLPAVDRVTLPLALFTGVCAGDAVRLLGLDVTIVGNAVSLPNAELVIGAQCSGVNSIIALTSLLTLTAYLLDGPLWGRLTLVAMAVPLAVLGNILRVASLLFVARSYGANAAFVFYHDYSGIAFFLAVILLLIPLARLLRTNNFRLEVI